MCTIEENDSSQSKFLPGLSPQPVDLGVGVAVGVEDGQDVPVEVVDQVRVVPEFLGQHLDGVHHHGGGDPLPCVNA